jgi:hypothetical protein
MAREKSGWIGPGKYNLLHGFHGCSEVFRRPGAARATNENRVAYQNPPARWIIERIQLKTDLTGSMARGVDGHDFSFT